VGEVYSVFRFCCHSARLRGPLLGFIACCQGSPCCAGVLGRGDRVLMQFGGILRNESTGSTSLTFVAKLDQLFVLALDNPLLRESVLRVRLGAAFAESRWVRSCLMAVAA